MYYPKLNEIPNTREQIDVFKGYNHNLRIQEGEFFDMKNLSSDHYPVLSPRKQRGIYRTTSKASGMSSNTNFCYVDGRYLYIGDERVDLSLTQGMKDIVGFGSNVVIFPDQKYVNTVNIADRGHAKQGVFDLPAALGTDNPKVVITMVDLLGQTLLNGNNKIWVGTVGVSNKEAYRKTDGEWQYLKQQDEIYTYEYGGDYWLRPSPYLDNSYTLYQLFIEDGKYVWAEAERSGTTSSDGRVTCGAWASFFGYYGMKVGIYFEYDDEEYTKATTEAIKSATVDTPYIKIKGTTIDRWENELPSLPIMDVGQDVITTINDGVKRSGIILGRKLSDEEYRHFLNETDLLREGQLIAKEWSPLVLDTPISITAPYNIGDEGMPTMDFVIEAGNRLWGCRYGYNNNGEWVNEIYASELGNFKNWNKRDNTSTDSYVASVGTSGAFTGAINYGGYPIFFKEDCIHKVYGNYPANFQIQTINCKGVQKGCAKSLAIVNEILYYKSRSAICAYDGLSPIEISPQMADVQYETAVGGALGNKYYVSMKKVGLEDFDLFVFDSLKGMWHKEDDTDAAQFCNHEGELYYIDRADNFIKSIKGTGRLEEDPIHWGAETGIIGATTPDNKYMSRIDIRMAIAKESKVSLHIEYDSMGIWERLTEVEGLTLTTVTIPVKPRRCDHFRLKIEGEGDAKIFAITKTMEVSG